MRGRARPKDLGTLDGSRGGLILPCRVEVTTAQVRYVRERFYRRPALMNPQNV
jgi:hypothetical protein